MLRYLDWSIIRLLKRNIDVIFNCPADRALINDLKPSVIIACGANPIIPKLNTCPERRLVGYASMTAALRVKMRLMPSGLYRT
jgi:hypothetical protein